MGSYHSKLDLMDTEAGIKLIKDVFEGKLAEALNKPGLIFLLGIPLAFSLLLPDLGGKNPFYYFLFLLLGYIFFAEPRFTNIIDRHKRIAVIIGILSITIQLGIYYLALDLPEVFMYYYGGFVYGVGTLSILIAMLGYARKWLNFGNSFTQYFSLAVYPLYILHQTAIIMIGFFVVRWHLPVWGKFTAIVLLSFVVCISVYDMLIKRHNALRFLFGMKPL